MLVSGNLTAYIFGKFFPRREIERDFAALCMRETLWHLLQSKWPRT
jgi:hypothetical protein